MLKTEGLSYAVEDKLLIDNLSLSFYTGSLYGILGPNGSGKTTFMKAVAGIWQPASGKVFWKGEELHAKERIEISKIVTYVPQNAPLIFDYTVEEFVKMGRYAHGTRTLPKGLLEKALDTVSGTALRKRSLPSLSSGERQRIYIARALITECPVLLLDEPTASLDIRHQLEIWHLLKGLVQRGKIVIVTNHDLIATQRFCDEIALFNHGKCLGFGKYQNILSKKTLNDVFGIASIADGRVDFELVRKV